MGRGRLPADRCFGINSQTTYRAIHFRGRAYPYPVGLKEHRWTLS